MLWQPAIFSPFAGLSAAESTRYGGVSPYPYASLNLGKSTGDHPDNVAENRQLFCGALGFQVGQMAWSKQVHGDQVCLVEQPGGLEGFDALMTRMPGLLLTVSVADCTPILIFDARTRALAAVHAGWRGTAACIVAKTLGEMARCFGTQGPDCYAYIGTCIDVDSFEVGTEVADVFEAPFKRYDTVRGKHFVDLKLANHAQLLEFGIPSMQIETSPYSTMLHNDAYFSHRLENGVTGRMLAAIGLIP